MEAPERPVNEREGTAPSFPSAERNKLIIYIGILLLLNIVITTSAAPDTARHLNGSAATAREIRDAIIPTLVFTTTVIGFVLGTIVALFPYKGLSYGRKYLRASLLSVLGLHTIFLALSIIGLLMR